MSVWRQELPSVVENSEAPAVETEEVVVEEEFDLSDVMSEEVEGGENSKEKKMREIEEQLKVRFCSTKPVAYG